MKNSNQLVAGYKNVGSIVRRNADGKEFVVTQFDEGHIYTLKGTDETVTVKEGMVETSKYEVVLKKQVSQTILEQIKLLDSRLFSMQKEAIEIFTNKFPSFCAYAELMNERQKVVYESIKHELGFYKESLERYDLLDELFISTLKTEDVKEDALQDEEDKLNMVFNERTVLERINLSVRSYNCLKRHGINTVGELVTMTRAEVEKYATWECDALKRLRKLSDINSVNRKYSVDKRIYLMLSLGIFLIRI